MSTTTEPLPTLTETVESLTGFEEVAIKERFGAMVADLLIESISMGKRALLFARLSRDPDGKAGAYKRAMALTVKELNEQFGDDEDDDEFFEDEPVTVVGKGEPPLASEPTSLPSSA